MKFVIQRVTESTVCIDGTETAHIGKGLLVLVGIGRGDTREMADQYLKKLLGMRIFSDENGKTNVSLSDVQGELLLVSQFTLYADCRRGNRPSFVRAEAPEPAEALYDYLVARCREQVPVVKTGRFGADMKVTLVNDGPFTIILDEQSLGVSQKPVTQTKTDPPVKGTGGRPCSTTRNTTQS